MNNILIFTYLQRHLKKMIPIIKELQKDQNINLTVILMTQEEKKLAEENGIPIRMLDEFTVNKRTQDFDLAWGLEPLINAIDVVRPDLFIAIEVNYILRNAIRYCKQQGIPNLIVQHGTPNQYSLHAFAPFEGDCFAAWGDFTKEFLTANHVDPQKIVLTGGVPFDRTLAIIPDREKIAQALDIDPGKKWIVFTTQGVGAGDRPSEEEIFSGCVEIAKRAMQHQDYQLIYQVHPGQTIEDIKKIIDTAEGHNAVVGKYKNTEELMAASEGVITFFSTTALDAVLLGKPLLLINLIDDKDFFPFIKMGVALGAYSKEEIGQAYDELIKGPKFAKANLQKAANYVNYKNDGNALRRIMNLCYQRLNIKGA